MIKHLLLVVVVLGLVGGDWKPDRRPIGLIWTGPGGTGWPPAEIASKGTHQIKDRPWKRYMWHMPASWDEKAGHMSGAQWFTLTRDQRSEFRKLNKLANDLDRKFYVYGGIAMGSPFELNFTVYGGQVKANDFYLPADHYAMWELVIAPWRKDSCDGWIFDAGAHGPYQRSALGWCKFLREEHSMWAAIEAFPLVGCPACVIDEKIAAAVPCVARYDFNPEGPKLVAPAGSEMHIWTVAVPDGNNPDGSTRWKTTMTVDEGVSWLKRGFILDPDEPHDGVVMAAYQKAGIPIP